MDPAVLKLILIIILVILSAFFSSAETSLLAVNKIKMRTLSESGHKTASLVLKLNESSSKTLSTILIGNNVVNLSASALSTIFMQEAFHNLPVSIATGVLTIIVLIFGEIVPKHIATLYADKLALFYAPIIYILCIILTPIIFILNIVSHGLMRLIGINPNKKADAITEDEFLTVVDVSHESGVIEEKERDMIENVVDFGDSVAKDIMVPRIDVEFIEDTATYEEVYDAFKTNNFSRMPIYHENTDNVVGVIFLKDFFAAENNKNFSVKKIARKPYFTFEYKKTSELLSELRQKNISIAVVLDEYGATAGILTVEDLLEEIVGELRDEYDFDEEDVIKKINDKEYLVNGQAKLDEINEETGLELESDDYDSIAGHVLALFERIPKVREEISDDHANYTIVKMDKHRIDKIKIVLNDVETEE